MSIVDDFAEKICNYHKKAEASNIEEQLTKIKEYAKKPMRGGVIEVSYALLRMCLGLEGDFKIVDAYTERDVFAPQLLKIALRGKDERLPILTEGCHYPKCLITLHKEPGENPKIEKIEEIK